MWQPCNNYNISSNNVRQQNFDQIRRASYSYADALKWGKPTSSSYVNLNEIPTWSREIKSNPENINSIQNNVSKCINDKVSLWKGDITNLDIECIVNAANSRLQRHR